MPVYPIVFVTDPSVTKIMRKAGICTILCFYSLPPIKNVEKQRAKVASSHVMNSQHFVGGEGEFNTIFKKPIIFCY